MSDADVQQAVTVDLVLQYNLNVRRIYAVYVETGGMSTESEVLRYLAGSATLPQLQRDLMAHAVNEQLNDPYPRAGTNRAPYSSASVAMASGYAVSEFDGERLAEHRLPSHHLVPLMKDAEDVRVDSLYTSGLLDAPVSGSLERLPRMTRDYFGVMGAAFTLITEDELVTKSSIGTLEGAMPRGETFCNQTIRLDRTLVIPDTLHDPMFKDSSFVTGPPFIRFYAGHPIQGPGGMLIGALCIIDDAPRSFSTADEHKLRTLAALVQLEIWVPSM
jgi:GAF domain-containing protein